MLLGPPPVNSARAPKPKHHWTRAGSFSELLVRECTHPSGRADQQQVSCMIANIARQTYISPRSLGSRIGRSTIPHAVSPSSRGPGTRLVPPVFPAQAKAQRKSSILEQKRRNTCIFIPMIEYMGVHILRREVSSDGPTLAVRRCSSCERLDLGPVLEAEKEQDCQLQS